MPKEISKAAKPSIVLAGLREVAERETANEGAGEVDTFTSPVLDPKEVRTRLGMTQAEFSAYFCLPIGTLKGWEQGRRVPDQTSQILLYVISQIPVHVAICLAKLHKSP